MAPADVDALVERARAGDRAAFAELHRRFSPMVHGVLLARARVHDAEDLVQEVFLAAWRGLSQLRETTHVGAWLATIARNAVARLHRRRGLELVPLPDELPTRESGDPDRDLRGAEILAVVRSLPEAYRETLVMRLVEGLSGPEIAAAVGLTPDSVRVNLSRGMKELRERLRRRGLA